MPLSDAAYDAILPYCVEIATQDKAFVTAVCSFVLEQSPSLPVALAHGILAGCIRQYSWKECVYLLLAFGYVLLCCCPFFYLRGVHLCFCE